MWLPKAARVAAILQLFGGSKDEHNANLLLCNVLYTSIRAMLVVFTRQRSRAREHGKEREQLPPAAGSVLEYAYEVLISQEDQYFIQTLVARSLAVTVTDLSSDLRLTATWREPRVLLSVIIWLEYDWFHSLVVAQVSFASRHSAGADVQQFALRSFLHA